LSGLKGFKRQNSLLSKDKLKLLNLKDNKLNTDAVCKILNLDQNIQDELKIIHTYNFDIFKIKDQTLNNELVTVVSYIMARESIFDSIPVDVIKFLPFLHELQSRYKDITYHNKTHAADLAQTFYYFCTTGELKEKCKLDSLEMFSYILAAACHDVEHPGFTNIFLIEK
jgi:cAMP-specific phosphodiesterase 4